MKKYLRALLISVVFTLIISSVASLFGCSKEETSETRKSKVTDTKKKSSREDDEFKISETTESSEKETTGSETEGSTIQYTEPSETTPTPTPTPAPQALPDAVFTRLSDDPVTEFVPGSGYGEIYPFLGDPMVSGTNLSLVGLFDESGRIVCDPVFNEVWRFNKDGYIVSAYEGDSTFSDYKCGFISHDGASFTGLIYDQYVNSDGKLHFYTFEDSEMTDFAFDTEKSEVVSKLTLKTLPPKGDGVYFGSIVKDRYIVYEDYYGFDMYVVDGKTGDFVVFPDSDGLYYRELAGNLWIMGTSENGTNPEENLTVYKINGELLYEKNTFSSFQHTMDDQILFQEGDNWVVTDRDGNRIYTLVPDPAHPIESFQQELNGYFAYYADAIEFYSKDFENVFGVKLDTPSDYYPVMPDYSISNEVAANLPLVLYCETSQEITFLNLVSGDSKTYSRSDLPGSPVLLPDRILVVKNGYDGSVPSYSILRDTDFQVIASGTGQPTAIQDKSTGKYYLHLNRESYLEGKGSIIDAMNGEVLVEDIVNPEQLNIMLEIYNDLILYDAYPNSFDDHAADKYPFTMLTDMDGKIYFLHYAENESTD